MGFGNKINFQSAQKLVGASFWFPFFAMLFLSLASNAIEVRRITRAPYTPQTWDIGLGVGYLSANTNLMLVDGNGSMRVTQWGEDTHGHVELLGAVAARDSQTHYMGFLGFRVQRFWPTASWSPFVRPLVGMVHSIELQDGVRDRWDYGVGVGSYYYLHPKADMRLEFRAAFGGLPFLSVLLTSQFKFDEAAQSYKSITPEGI